MIVAGTEPKGTVLVGLCEEDFDKLRNGLTLTKHGNPQYGFRELIIFMGEDNAAMIKTLEAALGGKPVRHDDLQMGSG